MENLNNNRDDQNDQPEFSTNPHHLRFPDDVQQPQQNPAAFDPQIPLNPKAITCFNALKHGGTAETMFIKGENPEDLYSLVNSFFEEFKPGTTSHEAIVFDYCRARWMLWRRQRAQSFCEYASDLQTPINGILADHVLQEIGRYDRYVTQAERAFKRALANVEAIAKTPSTTIAGASNSPCANRK